MTKGRATGSGDAAALHALLTAVADQSLSILIFMRLRRWTVAREIDGRRSDPYEPRHAQGSFLMMAVAAAAIGRIHRHPLVLVHLVR